jgi:hypothetical protein
MKRIEQMFMQWLLAALAFFGVRVARTNEDFVAY